MEKESVYDLPEMLASIWLTMRENPTDGEFFYTSVDNLYDVVGIAKEFRTDFATVELIRQASDLFVNIVEKEKSNCSCTPKQVENYGCVCGGDDAPEKGKLEIPEYYLNVEFGDLFVIHWAQNRPVDSSWVKVSKKVFDAVFKGLTGWNNQ